MFEEMQDLRASDELVEAFMEVDEVLRATEDALSRGIDFLY